MLPGPMADVVDLRTLYWTSWPIGQVNAFLRAHTPPGLLRGDSGQVSRSGVPTSYSVDYNPRSQPSWIYLATLATTVIRGSGGGSLVRVDAQVAWYPPRSAAEHINVGRYRAVTLTAPTRQTGPPRPVTRTFTKRAIMVRLADIVNSLPAYPDITVNCGAMSANTSYRLVFTPTASRWPRIVVATSGCAVDTVTVGQRTQPALFEKGALLIGALSRFLGLTSR